MKKKWVVAIFITKVSFCCICGQTGNAALFGPPLKIPLNISGGFGEIRTNHIHSGIDFRTGGEIGKTVYASSDGFISRIKIEPGGFGKAIYIDHPEGYTTVYAHLDALRDDITAYVKQKQYENMLFPIDVFPKKEDFAIKKGDSIGYSGNSGGSQGPHLHFEIRETVKQSPIQPLLFTFPITDTKAPSFYGLTLYPLAKESRVAGSARKANLQVLASGREFRPKNDLILIRGPIGIGTEVFDAIDSNANRTGFYMLTLKLDSTVIYKNEIASFSFAESRFINSMIDYAEYMKTRRKITKLFVDSNNKLSVYKALIKNGEINFMDTLVHDVEITASDTYGNKSTLRFKLKAETILAPPDTIDDNCFRYFAFEKENQFASDNFRLIVPSNALYKDLCLKYLVKPKQTGYFSSLHQVGDSSTPFHYPFEISIKPEGLPLNLMEKALIVRLDNNYATSIGGTIEKNFVKGKTYIMGTFAVALDTTPPRITPYRSFSTHYQGIKKTYLAFKIRDNLAGIRDYNGYIDGKWALFEYDAKNDLLIHQLDSSRFTYNTSTSIRIEVSDSKNNKSTFETKYRAN